MRQRDISLGKLLAQELAKALFMSGVGVRVQQTNRDAFYARRFERADRRCRRFFVERREHLAGRVEPFVDFEAQITRYQRNRPFEKKIVTFRPIAAADLVHVAKAFGRDQSRARALALEYGVDRYRRTVHEETRAGDVDTRPTQAIVDAAGQIVRSRQRLAAKDLRIIIDSNQVGEGTTYVNRNSHEWFRFLAENVIDTIFQTGASLFETSFPFTGKD